MQQQYTQTDNLTKMWKKFCILTVNSMSIVNQLANVSNAPSFCLRQTKSPKVIHQIYGACYAKRGMYTAYD